MTPLHLVSRLKLWRCAKVGARVEVLGNVYVVGGGLIEIGDDVIIDGRQVPVELHAEPGGVLIISHGCKLDNGVSIEAQVRVEIGPGCRLRSFSKVMDNNFHPVLGSRHVRPASRPVKLDAAVEVGERAIVLPGAWLEANVKLGPGVVIARHVKAGRTVTVPPPSTRPEAVRQPAEANPPPTEPIETDTETISRPKVRFLDTVRNGRVVQPPAEAS